jgi:hypothetical protein
MSDPIVSNEGSGEVLPEGQAPVAVREIRPRALIVRWFVEYNPFYLLSAACMLASCLALTNSLSWIPIATRRLMTLIVTLNVYEAALLGIGLFLITRRRLRRDGRMLLILQAFFLVDFTFLNAEIATADLRLGIWVNAVLFVLGAVKLYVVLRVLKPDFTPLQFAFVLVQMMVLFATPSVLWWMNDGRGLVGAKHLYVVGWATALIPALYEVVAWVDRSRVVSGVASVAPTRAYLVLPYLSLMTHIGILHYVYDQPFRGAHATPWLLGLTLILNRAQPMRLMPRKDLAVLRFLLPLAAVLVAVNNPFEFRIRSAYPSLTLTPLALAMAGAYLTYVYCFLAAHAGMFLAAGAVAGVAYVLGPSREQIGDGLKAAWAWTATLTQRLVPKTLADWGVVGLVASFAFLAIGFWVSLGKRGEEDSVASSAP